MAGSGGRSPWGSAPFSPGVSCGFAGLGRRGRNGRRRGKKSWFRWPSLALFLLLPALALHGLSGIGGWGSGDPDWFKHDAVLRDLCTHPWPVIYRPGGNGSEPLFLIYYVAWYLPAAAVGALTQNWEVAQAALTLWTLLGTLLAGSWLVVFARGRVGLAALIFFLFSGLDVLGKGSVNAFLRLPLDFGDWNDIEWWAQFAQYASNAAAFFWAPQHALGGWLPAALVVDAFWRRPDGEDAGLTKTWIFLSALVPLWTPFAAVGLAPILLATLWVSWRQRGGGGQRRFWRDLASLPNVAGALALLALVVYFAARLEPYGLPPEYGALPPGESTTPLLTEGHVSRPVLYLWFIALEFAGFSAALWVLTRRGGRGERCCSARPRRCCCSRGFATATQTTW